MAFIPSPRVRYRVPAKSASDLPAFPHSIGKLDLVNDSSVRESPRPASGSNDDPLVAALAAVLHRLSRSELVCCCALALGTRELTGGRSCRVEVPGGRPDAPGTGNGPDRAPPGETGPGWHRLPVRGPGSPEEPEAWLDVELRGDESAPPGLERLSSLAAVAGLVLERQRLAREVRGAREDADEARAVLGHALRGHLHAALLRADNLLLALRESGSPDLDEVRAQLEVLKGTVEEMVEEIRQVVEDPDVRSGASQRPSPGGREQVDVPELLREAGGAERNGDAPFRVEVQGEVPAVRADPGRLGAALAELLDLARRSRSAPTLTVRPSGGSSGVRVELSVDLPPGLGQGEPEPGGGAPPRGDPFGGAGSERRATLREVVTELGGTLRVEAGPGFRAKVGVVLPADGGS